MCLCVCVSVCLCVCASVCLCVCVSVCLHLCDSVSLSLCASVSLCLCASAPLCVSVFLRLCVSASLCLCVSVSLHLCVSASLCLCVSASLYRCVSVSLCLSLFDSVSPSLCILFWGGPAAYGDQPVSGMVATSKKSNAKNKHIQLYSPTWNRVLTTVGTATAAARRVVARGAANSCQKLHGNGWPGQRTDRTNRFASARPTGSEASVREDIQTDTGET